MPYGELRVDTITFTNGGVDTSITVSGLAASTTGNLTVTGTVSGNAANFVSGSFSTRVSGLTVAGTTGTFTSLTGTTTQGTTATFTTGSFTSLTGTTIQGTTATYTTGSFTSLTGTTTTGTTANFASGVFTTQVSGATITGTTVAATTGTFTTVTGGTTTITSGVFAVGSAAAPSISFSSDPNTGIYSPGGDQVAISTNGTGRLFVDSSGNIGIADSNPSANTIGAGAPTLVLRGTGAATRSGGTCFISQDGTGKTVQYHDGGIFYTQSTNATAQAFFTNNIERLRITSAGLVGIGTSAPQTGILDLTRNGTPGNISSYRQLRIGLDTNNNYSGFIGYGASVAGQSAGLIIESLDNGAGSKTIINPSGGSVGIGTSAPVSTLTITGNATLDANSFYSSNIYYDGSNWRYINNGYAGYCKLADAAGFINFAAAPLNSSGAGAVAAPANRLTISPSGTTEFLAAASTSPAVFKIGGGEVARFDSSGRLLLGTSTALSNVSISGTLAAPTVQIQSATGGGASASITRTTAGPGYFTFNAGSSGNNVTSGSGLGAIQFNGFDGTNYVNGAFIQAAVDGTPGTNDMPGRLVFSTTSDGASSPTERLRITSAGLVGIGTSAPAGILHVRSAATTAGWQLRLDSVGLSNESGFYRDASDNYEMVLRNGAGGLSYIKNNGGASTANLAFFAQGSERAQIDSSGRLLVGTSTSVWDALVEVARVGGNQFVGHRYGDNNFPAEFSLLKSRATSIGTNTIVQNNDVIGNINFRGADGSTYLAAAQISAQVDGTPGTNDMPGRLVFATTADGASSPTEWMRINSAGTITLGGGSPATNGAITLYPNNFAGTGFLDWNRASTATTANALRFKDGAVTVGSVTYSNTATAYNTSSDYRLKENIVAVTDGITRLQQLKPSRFNFIADPAKTVDGFIAHEVQDVVPEAITGEKDAVDDDGNPVYQGIDQSKMVPLVVAALQECIKKVEALESELALLKSKP